MIFPLIASIIGISLLGIALLYSGASRIIHRINDRINDRINTNWKRTFSIAVGIFSIILASMILIYPVFGIAFAGLLIGIALLVTGAQIITSGVIGKSRTDNLEDLR